MVSSVHASFVQLIYGHRLLRRSASREIHYGRWELFHSEWTSKNFVNRLKKQLKCMNSALLISWKNTIDVIPYVIQLWCNKVCYSCGSHLYHIIDLSNSQFFFPLIIKFIQFCPSNPILALTTVVNSTL